MSRYKEMVERIDASVMSEVSPDEVSGNNGTEKCASIRQACRKQGITVTTRIVRESRILCIEVTNQSLLSQKEESNVRPKNKEEKTKNARNR